MIKQSAVQSVLESALAQGADFAELYFENGHAMSISYHHTVQDISRLHAMGVGLYLIRDLQSVYVYSNDFSEKGLRELCSRGCMLLHAKASGLVHARSFAPVDVRQPNPVEIPPGGVPVYEKIRLLERCGKAARAQGSDVVDVELAYNEEDKDVLIANSEGVWAQDSRTTTRLRMTPTVASEHDSIGYFSEYACPRGFEAFRGSACEEYLTSAIPEMRMILAAPEAPNGHFPVIIEAGNPSGTFFHECCGHQLETNYDPANQYDLLENGLFFGKLGTQVASEKVTLIDDGTLPFMYGSSKFDDEGMPRQRNVLIENGILKSYLVNRMGSLKLGVPRNACGRRQNYTQPPAARMSNTYVAPGSDTTEEMIRSTPEGLYVTRMGGGHGGADFSIFTHTAYWIKNGAIDHPVKNAVLIGRGDESLRSIDRVGNQLRLCESGIFCGGASGLCNVTTSGASIRISDMLIGGKGGNAS